MSDDKTSAASKRAKSIESVLNERKAYLDAGITDRVAQCDVALEALGHQKPAGRRTPEADAPVAAPAPRNARRGA